MWYFVSLYLQQVLGLSAIAAGLAFVPMTLAIVVASSLAGRLVARFGAGKVLSVGMALIGAGMLVFSTIRPDGSYPGDVLLPSLLTASGIGLSFVPVTIAATTGVGHGDAGLASGLVNTSRQFGGSLGLAILATVASAHTAGVSHGGHATLSALTSGFHAAFVVGAAFGLAGALTAGLALARESRPAPAPAAASAEPR
jgi:MFS family permease